MALENPHLPPESSSFIGREAELAELTGVHAGARLLTLVGPAGIGKTRLGLQLASRLASSYPDGVWFVDLASVSDPDMLTHVVARALEVRHQPGQSPMQALIQRLRDAQALLVLDTCEHLLDGCAHLAVALISTCPHIRLIAISRELLETDGDTIWRVPPLSLPVTPADQAQVAASDAVQLFVARVRGRDQRFSLTASNSTHVGVICRQLDGLPLALELVAARGGSNIKSDVSSRLRVDSPPEKVGRAVSQRERILRSTLDWTHHDLSEPERVLFRRVGVFAGSWNLETAQSVCADARLSTEEIARGVDRLTSMSLVVVQRRLDASRYRMLDTVRRYALAQLDSSGELETFRQRHLEHMLSVAEREPPEALNAEHAALLEVEMENVRAALTWALSRSETDYALRLATAAFPLWYFLGHFPEGCDWLQRCILLAGDANTLPRARASAWLGQLLQLRGDYDSAERWLSDALERHQKLGERFGSALAQAMLGQLLIMRGDLLRARAACAEAADRLRELGQPLHIASRLQSAVIAVELSDPERAREAITMCEAQGVESSPWLAAWVYVLKGRVAAASEDLTSAHTLLSEALDLSRTVPEQLATLTALVELGYVQLALFSNDRALASLAEAVDLAHRCGERTQLARALEGVATSCAMDRPLLAIRLVSAADRLRSTLGAAPWPSDRRRIASWLPDLQRRLKSSQYQAAWLRGQATDLEAAVEAALALASGRTPDDTPPRDPVRLTEREHQVVSLLARALTTQQIADELSISPATARTHIEHVLVKLGLHSRAQVIVWANKRSPAAR